MKPQTVFQPADILLPKEGNLTQWSVVACDQYTSQPEYWEETEKLWATPLHPTLDFT